MSRLRSAPAAKGKGKAKPAAAASRAPGRQVMVPTARSDVYVTLLGVALGAILLGCLFLVLVLNRYEFKTKVSARTGTRPAALALAAASPVSEISPTVHL